MHRHPSAGRDAPFSNRARRLLLAAAILLFLLAALSAAWWTVASARSAILPNQPAAAILATVLVLAFAVAARALRAVTTTGALAGAFTVSLLFLGGGAGAFAAIALVFLLTFLATRLGHGRKLQLGIAQGDRGRNASQVLANTGVAALAALLAWQGQPSGMWLAISAAALAEAAADTVSSEVGQAVAWPTVLVTTWRRVPPGSHGGVSLPGTLAGLFAAALVTATCTAARVIDPPLAGIVLLAGLSGMLADSLLGATLEQRGLMGNDAVNLSGTLVAAAVTLVFS